MKHPTHLFISGYFGILLLVAVVVAAAPTPDRSWRVAEYLWIGMPDPGRLWTASDYRDCRRVLLELDRTNRVALPPAAGETGATVFHLVEINSSYDDLLRNKPEAERLITVRYLREDLPLLWRYVLPGTQRQAFDDLEDILLRTHHEGVRRELVALRGELQSISACTPGR